MKPSTSELKSKVLVKNVIVLNKNDKIDIKNIETDKCVKTNVITKPIKSSQEEIKSQEITKCDTTENQNSSLTYNNIDVTFDNLLLTEDSSNNFKYTYDPDSSCTRKLEDYKIEEILKQKINASVYSEELEIEQMRVISATETHDLFSYFPENKTKYSKGSKKDKILSKLEASKNNDNENTETESKGKQVISLKQYQSRLTEKMSNDEDELFDFAVLSKSKEELK